MYRNVYVALHRASRTSARVAKPGSDAKNSQIATYLHLAEGTVKRHLVNIYRKMKVGSRSEAARKALRDEWITIGDITDEEEQA